MNHTRLLQDGGDIRQPFGFRVLVNLIALVSANAIRNLQRNSVSLKSLLVDDGNLIIRSFRILCKYARPHLSPRVWMLAHCNRRFFSRKSCLNNRPESFRWDKDRVVRRLHKSSIACANSFRHESLETHTFQYIYRILNLRIENRIIRTLPAPFRRREIVLWEVALWKNGGDVVLNVSPNFRSPFFEFCRRIEIRRQGCSKIRRNSGICKFQLTMAIRGDENMSKRWAKYRSSKFGPWRELGGSAD